MHHATFDASQTANGTPANNDSSARIAQLRQLYLTNYQTLVAACYEAHPKLLVFDADRIVGLLSEQLPRYKGPSIDAPFLKWATGFVSKEALRYKITADITAKYRRVIDAAIRRYRQTPGAYERYIEDADVRQEIHALIFEKAHGLNKAGTAKLSTRLTALVKKHCWLYHTSKMNRRHHANVLQLRPYRIEFMTAQDIASELADQSESEREAAYGG